MKTMRKGAICLILLSYAFGASTFSHMITMNHPEMDMTMDHSNHEKIDTDSSHKKCVQTCEKIEKMKMSSLANSIIIKTITFNYISFPTPPLQTIHSTPLAYYYINGGPPGEFAFSPLHLIHIASTVLTI